MSYVLHIKFVIIFHFLLIAGNVLIFYHYSISSIPDINKKTKKSKPKKEKQKRIETRDTLEEKKKDKRCANPVDSSLTVNHVGTVFKSWPTSSLFKRLVAHFFPGVSRDTSESQKVITAAE